MASVCQVGSFLHHFCTALAAASPGHNQTMDHFCTRTSRVCTYTGHVCHAMHLEYLSEKIDSIINLCPEDMEPPTPAGCKTKEETLNKYDLKILETQKIAHSLIVTLYGVAALEAAAIAAWDQEHFTATNMRQGSRRTYSCQLAEHFNFITCYKHL